MNLYMTDIYSYLSLLLFCYFLFSDDTLVMSRIKNIRFITFGDILRICKFDLMLNEMEDDGDDDDVALRKKVDVKYEDKYIEEVRQLTTDVFLSAEETQQKLDKLMNNYVFENTPVGNVIMRYNNKREMFEYYCDCNVPYTILEVVCRKYVITFKCKMLFIDMENELKDQCDKMDKMESDRLENEKRVKLQREQNTNELPSKKKDVFAKFKKYNTEAGTGHVSIGAPSKNSIPNVKTNVAQDTKVLLKEHTNRYSYQGKTSNFSVLQKIDRKVVDKKLAMSFADFKKMNGLSCPK